MAKKTNSEKATKQEMKEAIVEVAESSEILTQTKKSRFPKINLSRRFLTYFGIGVIVFGALGGASFFYIKYQEVLEKSKVLGSNVDTIAATEELITKVSKIAELPSGEAPTIATVSDREQLSGQPFFEKAQNGDKVLIYQQSKTAFLFRPSTGKIINIGPVNVPSVTPVLGASTASDSASVSPSPDKPKIAKVVLLNGTSTTGLTRVAESELTNQSVENIEIADRDNSKNGGYEETLVVDLSGKSKNQADSIANVLGGSISSLPEGEERPSNVDIVVILGANFVR